MKHLTLKPELVVVFEKIQEQFPGTTLSGFLAKSIEMFARKHNIVIPSEETYDVLDPETWKEFEEKKR